MIVKARLYKSFYGGRYLLMASCAELLESVVDAGFTGEVGDKVAYSNVAYFLLGLALENTTGMSFEEALQDVIFGPLGLTGTTITPPEKERTIIPVGQTWYGTDFNIFAP